MNHLPRKQMLQLPAADGWLHALLIYPGDMRARAAVVLCPPLAEERKSGQRAMIDGACHLAAAAGCVTLKIDYRGTGDSSGDFASYTLADWLSDIDAAAAWLRERLPEIPLIYLGLRVGAALALAAARDHQVILWEPITGQPFLRQLLQRHMVNNMVAYGKARTSRDEIEASWAAGGSVDIDGYLTSSAQARDLEGLEFTPRQSGGLAIWCGGGKALRDALEQSAPRVAAIQLRTAPFWNSVGHVDTREIAHSSAAWVLENHTRARFFTMDGPTAASDAESLKEKPVEIPLGSETLRAIVHLPDGGDAKKAFVFLGGWSGDRQGPHRLFLSYARRLAARGHLVLRLDYRGRGESDGEVENATIEGMVADAVASIRWLEEGPAAGAAISVVAICSGCKVAVGAVAELPRVERLVLWSAEAMGSLRAGDTNLRKTLGALRAYWHKLFRKETWGKLFRGQIQGGMVGKALARHETRSAQESENEDRWLESFKNYRGRVRFVYGGSDPDAAPSAAAYSRFCRRHRIRYQLDTIPHAGHSFYSHQWREELMRRTDEWLFDC